MSYQLFMNNKTQDVTCQDNFVSSSCGTIAEIQELRVSQMHDISMLYKYIILFVILQHPQVTGFVKENLLKFGMTPFRQKSMMVFMMCAIYNIQIKHYNI